MFAAEFKHLETIKRDQPEHTACARCKQQTYFRKTIAAVVQVVFIWTKRLSDPLAYTCAFGCLLVTWNGACAPFKFFG